MDQVVNLDEWYNPTQAAKRLTANSGKKVSAGYMRTLARYGKIRVLKLGERASLYNKADVDAYIVEERGEKSGRAKRIKAHNQTHQEPASKEATSETD